MRLRSANTEQIVGALCAYELDLALVEGPVSEPLVEATPWRKDELVVISSPTHPLASRGEISAADLTGELVLVREPGSGTRKIVQAALDERGISLRRTLELGNTEAIKQAAIAGVGVALISRAAVRDQLAASTLVTLPAPELIIHRTFSRLSLPGRLPSATARAFEEVLVSAAGQ